MSFSSMTFVFVFFPAATVIYYAVHAFGKALGDNITILLLSLCFYAWYSLSSLSVILVYAIILYTFGTIIEKLRNSNQETPCRITTIFAILYSVLVLSFFKYHTYIWNLLSSFTGASEEKVLSEITIPLGISFVVFSGISYIIDIYRGSASGSAIDSLTYLFFFPKVISGPIVKWKDFHPQLASRSVVAEQISSGIDLIIIGLAKKVILADIFGTQINMINNEIGTTGIDTPTIWIRSLLFLFQIYYDFSGYSDIAIGLGKLFGFKMANNFNYPYVSHSISEFWRRWHISLGSWFREYVYIPLGGNRRGNVYANLFIVFLLTGIWHGDDWTYVIWGICNGLAVIIERAIRDRTWYKRIHAPIKWFLSITFIYMAWIIFMSSNMTEAISIYKSLFIPVSTEVNFSWHYFLTRRIVILLVISIIGSLGLFPYINEKLRITENKVLVIVRRVLLIILFAIDIMFIVNSTYSPFLYFQF